MRDVFKSQRYDKTNKNKRINTMASQADVKKYLAYWFQLGKKVIAERSQETYAPDPVIEGDHYSSAFEQCWQDIVNKDGKGYYLEGTDETIAELLSSEWLVTQCARCDMPVPIPERQTTLNLCPCNDLPSWPNEELPQPRSPINSNNHLFALKDKMEASLNAE